MEAGDMSTTGGGDSWEGARMSVRATGSGADGPRPARLPFLAAAARLRGRPPDMSQSCERGSGQNRPGGSYIRSWK